MGFWVMPLLLLSLLLMPLGLDGATLYLAGQGLDIIVATARIVSNLPGASIMVQALPVAALVVYWIGGLWLALWKDPRLRLMGFLPLALLLTSPYWSRPADIMIAPEGDLIALRPSIDAPYYFSSRRSERFARGRWQESAAQADAPLMAELESSLYRCDQSGCLYEWRQGGEITLIAMPRSEQAFDEDCRLADIIISRFRAPGGCDAPMLLIDRAMLLAEGGHAIWFDREGMSARSVEELRGNRPWTWNINR